MKRMTHLTALGFALAMAATAASAQEKLDRTVLPIAEPKRPTYTELDARKVKAPPRFEVKAPKGAPNVVIVLIDDIGFGGPSTFGGPIRTPTMDQLAQNGLRFNNFHTTALCSPTRVALKSGRNHHTANAGSIMESCDGASPATPGRSRTASRRWRRCCGSTATAPAPSASGTRPPPGRPACRARSTAGPRTRASTSSTASSAARPTSGIR